MVDSSQVEQVLKTKLGADAVEVIDISGGQVCEFQFLEFVSQRCTTL